MRIQDTALAGVKVIEVSAHADERGLFARTYDEAIFAAAGLPTHWPQCNTSYNRRRATLRGLHCQAEPHGEPKLVRCTRGRIFDVAVDVRADSPTYCRWVGVELSVDERNALYIPPGCAHGFLTLEDDSEVFYQMGTAFVPGVARGWRWDDPAFGISWPMPPEVIAERDQAWPGFGVKSTDFNK